MLLSEAYEQKLNGNVIMCNGNHGKFPVPVDGALWVVCPKYWETPNAVAITEPKDKPPASWSCAIYPDYESYLKDFGNVKMDVMQPGDCYHGTIYKFIDGIPAEVSVGFASSNRHQLAVRQGRRQPELTIGRTPFVSIENL